MIGSEIVSMFDLTGQVAIVTGGAVNLGFDAASVLAAAGCSVAITSRDPGRGRHSAEKLQREYGVDTLSLPLDQTEYTQVEEVAGKVERWKGGIDILVNNAGGGSGSSPALLFDRDPADIDRLLAVNLNGIIYCCRQIGQGMAARHKGKIINIASVAGVVGRDRRMYERAGMKGQPVDYAAAKAGVIGLTRDLAGYLGPMGVCVNAISPGGFERGQPEEFVKDYSDRTPLGRMGRDGVDLKGAVLFLASPASDYVTGHNLVVDGGFSIWQ
jgi:NAD(P)-dependent dehydrogenase (short-subunit alcohol dehydrogenase family)